MTSRTGTEDSREADPGDVEIEEAIGPIVETAWETPGADTRGSQWHDEEEEEVTFETEPHAQDASQGQDDAGRQPCIPQAAGAKTTGLEATEDGDEDEQGSPQGWEKDEIVVLTHALQEASGIKISGQVLNWLKKESITSIANLLLVGPGGLAATGWPLKEVERRALGFLCLWWDVREHHDFGLLPSLW